MTECPYLHPNLDARTRHPTAETRESHADDMALRYLNKWLVAHGRDTVDFEAAGGRTEAELY